MPILEAYTGSEAVAGTEWSLITDSSGPDSLAETGVYQIFLDLSDMVAGDQLRIKFYEKVRSGDTQRSLYSTILSGQQSDPIWVSPSIIFLHGWDVTVQTLSGTITINWSVRKLA